MKLKDELVDLEETFNFNLSNTSAHIYSGLVSDHEDELNELKAEDSPTRGASCVIMEIWMKVDARGMKHPEPLEKLRDVMRNHCSEDIDVELLLDSSEYAKTVAAFARMSKCQTKMEKAEGHYVLSIKGARCSCA